MTGLVSAIIDNDFACFKSLLAKTPDLAMRRISWERLYEVGIFHHVYVGDTALHVAAAGYRPEIVQVLVAAGADPNAINRRRATPLHYAADGFVTGPSWDPARQVETIRVLLSVGADIDARDQNGATALHRAVRTRCAAAVERLLSAGADKGMRNKSGSTPAHLAMQNTGRGGSGEASARQAQKQIIESLLSHGADLNAKDGRGRSVIASARSEWIRDLLLKRLA